MPSSSPIFSACIFYLDPNAQLRHGSTSEEQKSQDFADGLSNELTNSITERDGTVLTGA